MSEPAAVRVEGVTHRYGGADGGAGSNARTALRDLSLTVHAGETFALLGPNGSGKTTLFRILATLLPPTRGAASVFGHDVTAEARAVRRALGVAFQQPALDEALTVAENLRCHAAFFGMRGADAETRLDALLKRFDIADRRDERVGTLSGGLRRRADLARALLHQPRLLLLDEPTAGLDPAARHAFWRHLARLRDERGTTLLVATHLMEEAERAERVAILYEGERVACGAPDALKRELGQRALWVECAGDPEALRERLQTQMNLAAHRVGERLLRIDHEEAPALVSRLYDAFPGEIERATVRRPTLEDVFMARTQSDAPLAASEPFQIS